MALLWARRPFTAAVERRKESDFAVTESVAERRYWKFSQQAVVAVMYRPIMVITQEWTFPFEFAFLSVAAFGWF